MKMKIEGESRIEGLKKFLTSMGAKEMREQEKVALCLLKDQPELLEVCESLRQNSINVEKEIQAIEDKRAQDHNDHWVKMKKVLSEKGILTKEELDEEPQLGFNFKMGIFYKEVEAKEVKTDACDDCESETCPVKE